MALFRFRTPPHGRVEPLATQQTAAAWLRKLPAVDTIGRQQIVIRAIQTTCQSGNELEFDQVGAIEYLDTELAPDRDRLITQCVAYAEGSAALADRIWQAAYEICQGFIVGYRSLLGRALGAADDRQWQQAIPRLIARLIRFYGTDAKLRVLKNEPWIPAKWAELHGLYKRAVDLGLARAPLGPDASWSGAAQPTIEREYLAVLLTHLLNTGMLAPREIDWAAAQVGIWAAGLELDEAPRAPGGFVVDLGGKRGLVRRSGDEVGATLRYLDTRPVIEQFERALDALCRRVAVDPEGEGPVSRQRIAILERLRPAVSPEAPPAVPRDPRTDVNLSAQVRIGLPQICHELAPSDLQNSALEIAAAPAAGAIARDAAWNLSHSIDSFARAPLRESLWRIENRSGTGLRIVARGGLGQALALGKLVAIREPRDGEWVLGVVRRVARPSAENIEAGVSIIASRVIAVALHAKRQVQEDMGFVVDGVDVSTVGERFDGLYLPGPSRPNGSDQPLAANTLVVPSSRYSEGRNVILITTRSVYTVALRAPLERHADWIWVAIDIVHRAARG